MSIMSAVIGGCGLSQSQVDASILAANNCRHYDVIIDDDGVWEFPFGNNLSNGIVIVGCNNSGHRGIFAVRARSSPFCDAIASTGIDTSTSVLTGTTGTDGNVTLSAASDASLYLENRRNFAMVFSVVIASKFTPDVDLF